MALHKLPKTKSFEVDYCGCTAASLLLKEHSVREALNSIRKAKVKRDFVKTTVDISKDEIRIVYDNEHKYTTHVPAKMVGRSAVGKAPYDDTVGVVYVSPLNGRHYPAFVHVYRCESSVVAKKLNTCFHAYLRVRSQRSYLTRLEKELLNNNLLNVDQYNSSKAQSHSSDTTTLASARTNTVVSSSSASSDSRPEKADPVKSITQELQKKIKSQEPLLFPPKDYDTAHAGHGNLQRAQAWKSTEPIVIGVSTVDPDRQQVRRPAHTNGIRRTESNDELLNANARSRLSTQRSDLTNDPVETVSLAFDFLKDETGSILTENDGDIEHLEVEQQDKPPIFRFRPPQITAMTKKLFTRNNNYEFTNGSQPSNVSPSNRLDAYYNYTRYQTQQQVSHGQRTRSETMLENASRPGIHLSPRYDTRLVNGGGAPIPTNPLWTAAAPTMAGSQPNLLSYQSDLSQPQYRRQQFSPTVERRMTAAPLQHPLYSSYPNTKPAIIKLQSDHPLKRSGQAPPPPTSRSQDLYRKQTAQSQYFDTNEFILRASDGPQSPKHSQNINRPASGPSTDYRHLSRDIHDGAMLDVYY